MKTVCAWCNVLIKKDEATGNKLGPISHGICSSCMTKMLSFRGQPLRDYLNKFEKPVFLITEEVKVGAGNQASLEFLQKTNKDIEGRLAGDVFECKFSKMQEGCGGTIHCKSCAIRNAISDTLKTGKSLIEVPAYPDLVSSSKRRIKFLITTELVDNYVLLRIDDIDDFKGVK